MFAVKTPIGGGVFLQFTIDGFVQALQQYAFLVACKQRIPVAAPQQLDDVPARAGKQALQLLNDGAVAAHRAIQPLQIAVHHKNQVIQFFACGERQTRQRFRFIHFAVPDKRPYLAIRRRADLPIFQVAHKARLINRVNRPQPHRRVRKLPKVRHQPRMRIRRQATAARFLPVFHQLIFRESPFEKRARVNAGG